MINEQSACFTTILVMNFISENSLMMRIMSTSSIFMSNFGIVYTLKSNSEEHETSHIAFLIMSVGF